MFPFSTYKYHLGAWGKTQPQRITNTRVLFDVFFFSSLYYLSDIGFHKVRKSFAGLIDLTSCFIFGEKRETHMIWNTYLFSVVHIFLDQFTLGYLVSNKFTQIYILAIYITNCSGFIFIFLLLLHFSYFSFLSCVIPSLYTKNTKICLLKKKCINSWLQ